MNNRFFDIFLSVLFSILVIYCSVGIPIIRTGCPDCKAEMEMDVPAVAVNLLHENIGSSCENDNECCCDCCRPDSKTDGMNCKNVCIEKLSQIEPFSYSASTISNIPEIDLLYYSYTLDVKNVVSASDGSNNMSFFLKQPPDVYLTLLCSLLI